MDAMTATVKPRGGRYMRTQSYIDDDGGTAQVNERSSEPLSLSTASITFLALSPVRALRVTISRDKETAR